MFLVQNISMLIFTGVKYFKYDKYVNDNSKSNLVFTYRDQIIQKNQKLFARFGHSRLLISRKYKKQLQNLT